MRATKVEPSLLRSITGLSAGGADMFSNLSGGTGFLNQAMAKEGYDFIRFARTEGEREVSRVLTNAATDKDGNPSETLIKAKQERLDN